MQQQRGFTLIELIIVIVILGILAVTAAPKFLDISSQANTAVANGIEGNVVASANLVRAAWLVAGSAGTTTTIDGQAVDTNVKGYPAATADGIGVSIDLSSGWSSIVGATSNYIFVATDAAPTADDNGAICVRYTLVLNGSPTTSQGVFTFDGTASAAHACA